MLISIVEFTASISIFLFSLVIHEITHARVAYYLGDPTAKNMGRFSFNPLKHMTLLGTLLPIGLYLLGGPAFGFAKPVKYNPLSFKNPKRDMILVGLAAPIVNLIIAVIAYILYNRLSILPEAYLQYFNKTCVDLCLINLLLGIFNLIPIPPLDGSIIYMSYIINKNPVLAQKLESASVGALFSIVVVMPLLGKVSGEDYNLIGTCITWCLNKFVSTLSFLAG